MCVCVCIALVRQHVMRMRCIILLSVTCPALPYVSKLSYKQLCSEQSTSFFHILSQINPIHALPFYSFKIHLISSFHACLKFLNRHLPSSFTTQCCMHSFSPPCMLHAPGQLALQQILYELNKITFDSVATQISLMYGEC